MDLHPTSSTATLASDESLRQRLALAHERITQLRTEDQQLRESLATAHGQLRAAREIRAEASRVVARQDLCQPPRAAGPPTF
uniref:hypothetical protein n=1 Tax=Nocardia donostiensis TaxID=1538463 RepID=UPI00111C4ADF|nr:hypothetical protein [Nocardia donostiensis]